MKTRDVKAGEWVRPVMTGYLMECCKCGGVHVMDFRVSKERDGSSGVEMRSTLTVPDLETAIRLTEPSPLKNSESRPRERAT